MAGEVFLYPSPVLPDQKYLIACVDEAQAKEIQEGVAEGHIPHPDSIDSPFEFLRFHTDGNTRILGKT